MKVDYFDIQLEHSQYLAGSTVCGSIIISAPQAMKLQGISVRLHGEAHTSWVNKTSDKIYESDIPLLDQCQNLTGYLSQISDGELLPEGVHTMTFSFDLPANLPSAVFNEYFGWVRYLCIASIHVAKDSCLALITGSTEIKVDKTLTVHSLVNKDFLPNVRQPFKHSDRIELIGCFGSQGTLGASLILAETGFLAGETLPVDIQLSNHTKKRIKRCPVLVFCQTINFRAKNRYEPELFDCKDLTQVLESASVGPAGIGEETVRSIFLEIPPNIPPTTLNPRYGTPSSHDDPDNIITISYYLKLDMDSFELIVPVVICSVGTSKTVKENTKS